MRFTTSVLVIGLLALPRFVSAGDGDCYVRLAHPDIVAQQRSVELIDGRLQSLHCRTLMRMQSDGSESAVARRLAED